MIGKRDDVAAHAAWIGLGVAIQAALSGALAAPTAEVAKKCAALTAQSFPPRVAGNPAAGSARGGGPSEQAFFRKCLENDGNVEVLQPSTIPLPPERPH